MSLDSVGTIGISPFFFSFFFSSRSRFVDLIDPFLFVFSVPVEDVR